MSIEGFVARQRERRSALHARIEQITRDNGGKEPKRLTTKMREELKALDEAIYRATRKGVIEE